MARSKRQEAPVRARLILLQLPSILVLQNLSARYYMSTSVGDAV